MITQINRTGLTLGLFVALAATGLAWQQTPATVGQDGADVAPHQRGEGKRRGHRRGGHDARGIGRALSRLNLSDAQQQQVRAIMTRNFQNTQAQRDELRQLAQQRRQGAPLSPDAEARIEALHKSLEESTQRASDEALATLTPEQRAQLEQFKQERRARGHRGGKGMRGERARGFMRGLELTEAQRQQMSAIRQRFTETIKPQREALRQLREEQRNNSSGTDNGERAQALRAQIGEASKAMREEMLNVLTPAQRTQIEQQKQEMQNRREQFRQRRPIQ